MVRAIINKHVDAILRPFKPHLRWLIQTRKFYLRSLAGPIELANVCEDLIFPPVNARDVIMKNASEKIMSYHSFVLAKIIMFSDCRISLPFYISIPLFEYSVY